MEAVPVHSSARAETGVFGSGHNEANSSGVSWSAVIAGAFVSAALGLILLALGAGLGLSSVSPWSNVGASASAVGAAAIVWLIVLEILSSSMGGYLAGRLRTKWTSVHSDEVYFRDTAHGFLAWAVALVITAAFLASTVTTMLGTSSTSTGHAEDRGVGTNAYFVDSLFRSATPKVEAPAASDRSEAENIFAHDLRSGDLSAGDKTYLGQLVAARTGLSQGDAESRVSNVFSNAQQAMEATRKAVAHSLLWTFVALLIGAFCASVTATLGGRQRDHVVVL